MIKLKIFFCMQVALVSLAWVAGHGAVAAAQHQGPTHDQSEKMAASSSHSPPSSGPALLHHNGGRLSSPSSQQDKAIPPPYHPPSTAAAIHTNQHGLIAVQVMLEQSVPCNSGCTAAAVSTISRFLWNVTVDEAPAKIASADGPQDGSADFAVPPFPRLSRSLSLQWTVDSCSQANIQVMNDTDQAHAMTTRSGHAFCSFVIPLESFKDGDSATSSPASSSLMHTSPAARTFIVSLWRTNQDDDGQPHLVMRRLATLPRMSSPRQTIDPVAKVVLKHSLPDNDSDCGDKELHPSNGKYRHVDKNGESSALGQYFWIAVIIFAATYPGKGTPRNVKPRILHTEPDRDNFTMHQYEEKQHNQEDLMDKRAKRDRKAQREHVEEESQDENKYLSDEHAEEEVESELESEADETFGEVRASEIKKHQQRNESDECLEKEQRPYIQGAEHESQYVNDFQRTDKQYLPSEVSGKIQHATEGGYEDVVNEKSKLGEETAQPGKETDEKCLREPAPTTTSPFIPLPQREHLYHENAEESDCGEQEEDDMEDSIEVACVKEKETPRDSVRQTTRSFNEPNDYQRLMQQSEKHHENLHHENQEFFGDFSSSMRDEEVEIESPVVDVGALVDTHTMVHQTKRKSSSREGVMVDQAYPNDDDAPERQLDPSLVGLEGIINETPVPPNDVFLTKVSKSTDEPTTMKHSTIDTSMTKKPDCTGDCAEFDGASNTNKDEDTQQDPELCNRSREGNETRNETLVGANRHDTRAFEERIENLSDAEESYESTLPPGSDYRSEDDLLEFPDNNDYDDVNIDEENAKTEFKNVQIDHNENEKTMEGNLVGSPPKEGAASPLQIPGLGETAKGSNWIQAISGGSESPITPLPESKENGTPGGPRKKSRQEEIAKALEQASSPEVIEVVMPSMLKKRGPRKRPYQNSSIVADHVPSNKLQQTSSHLIVHEKALDMSQTDKSNDRRRVVPKMISLPARKKIRTKGPSK